MTEAVRPDLRSRADHHDLGADPARQIDDLMFRDPIEKGELGGPSAVVEPRFDLALDVLLQLVDRLMHAVETTSPAWQTADGPFYFILRSLIDNMHDGPGKAHGQKLRGTVEQSRNAETAHADQRDPRIHRSWNQSAIADEMRIGGIDRTPTRRYWPVVTSIPRLRTSESQSMVASEP